jgi:AraC family transcriptional regulator
LILREMPAIWDDAFRPWFYSRWGRENCVIGARTRKAEYPAYRQCLSIKAAWGGSEDYFIDGRRVAVDDDTFIILNDGRTYASRIRSRAVVTSFSIFFRPGMADEVMRTMYNTHEALLENPEADAPSVEFSEHVRRHDGLITPLLRHIHHHVAAGVTDEDWYEDQLFSLLRRMIELRIADKATCDLIPAARSRTRRELYRRVGLAADFIHMRYAEAIDLEDIAAAALMAPFHCMRVFRSVYGTTPAVYLNRRRVQVAARLLQKSTATVDEIAALVGFGGRTTLFRQMKRFRGMAPSAVRDSAASSRGLVSMNAT